MGTPRRGAGRGHLAAGLWLLVLILWLASALGHSAHPWISRAAVLLAGGALAVVLGARIRATWSSGGAPGRILLLLVAASVLVHFVGLGHDIAHGYFKDEGTYRKAAQEINQGLVLRPWFIYPHLLFYLDAIALWIASLFEPAVAFVARFAYGVEGPRQIQVLVARHVTAALGALTVLPAFAIARRLGGTAAAALGGALVVLSPLYVQVAHLNISDVPAAFFSTLTLAAAAALLDRESRRGWVWAGLWAGLAAGSKYPAGVVAVAIVAVALRWALAERRFPIGLVISGGVALAAFAAATPSLLAFPGMVFRGGGADILFGVRQYAGAGWTGVVQASNPAYYLGWLRHSIGLPALLLGLAGLVVSPAAVRRRLLWLLPFPALYLGLILRMNVAVSRNLVPVLPALAIFAGAGVAALLFRGEARRPAWRRVALAAGLALCLAGPLYRTVEESVRQARESTRDVAASWVHANVAPGAVFLAEFYTPSLGNRWRYPVWRERFATRFPRRELRRPEHDFLFLASAAYERYLDPAGLVQAPWDEAVAARYREIFDSFELVREFTPGRWQNGPTLRLYRLDPEPLVYRQRAVLPAAGARVSHGVMRPKGGRTITYRRRAGQWSLFKAHLAAGRYRVAVDAELAAPGRLRVSNRANAEIDRREVPVGGRLEIELPADDKVFLYLQLPETSRLRGLALERIAVTTAAPEPAAE